MREAAIMCSYGHQDVYRILGRDPIGHPLTRLERAVFSQLLIECWEAKVAPSAAIGAPPAEEF